MLAVNAHPHHASPTHGVGSGLTRLFYVLLFVLIMPFVLFLLVMCICLDLQILENLGLWIYGQIWACQVGQAKSS
jgi:hypothetical protein